MKTINRISLVALLLAATLSQSSSSKAATTPNLRAASRGIRNMIHDDTQDSNSKTAAAKINEETILESQNERSLTGPPPGGGGGSSSSSSSDSSSSSSSSSSTGGTSDSTSTTAPTASSETSGRTEGTKSVASESLVSGFKWKDLNFVGTDKSAASIMVATVAGVMCLALLLSIMAIASYKIITSKSTNDDSDGILRNDNNKAEQLVSASLD